MAKKFMAYQQADDAAAAMYGGEYAAADGGGMEFGHSYYYDDGMVGGNDWQSSSGWHSNIDGDDECAGDMTLWSYY